MSGFYDTITWINISIASGYFPPWSRQLSGAYLPLCLRVAQIREKSGVWVEAWTEFDHFLGWSFSSRFWRERCLEWEAEDPKTPRKERTLILFASSSTFIMRVSGGFNSCSVSVYEYRKYLMNFFLFICGITSFELMEFLFSKGNPRPQVIGSIKQPLWMSSSPLEETSV